MKHIIPRMTFRRAWRSFPATGLFLVGLTLALFGMAPALFAGSITTIKDSSGNVVACVHDSGHLVLSGEMKFNCGTITSSGNKEILVKDGSTCLARFELDASKVFFPPTTQAPDSPYVLFLKDAEKFFTHPIPSGTYPVRVNAPSRIASAFKTSDGSMINHGLVCENRPDPTVFPGGQVFLPGTSGQSNYLANLRIALNRIKDKPSGSNIKLAFVGGSITQAAGSPGRGTEITSSTWYAAKVRDHMANSGFLPTSATVTLINAGRAGMGSDAAMCYLTSDVLAQNPDLVVVECSANDYLTFNGDQIPVGEARAGTQYRADQRAMEGVLRQLLTMGTPPGVIMLGMVYGNSDTTTSPGPTKNVPSSTLRPVSCTFQDRHLRVARHYGVPLVSYRDEYWPDALEAADPLMRTFYNHTENPADGDYVHPNGTGHGKMADLITALLDTAKNASGTPSYSLPSQIFSSPGSYGTMTEVSADNADDLGIDVTPGENGDGDTWSVTSANVHRFTSLLQPEDYTVSNLWESIVLTQEDADDTLNYIEFTGIQKSDVIVEWSWGDNNHGTLHAVVNNDTQHPVEIKQGGWSTTVGWTWVGFNLPNQQGGNTIKFIPQTVGKHCIIHRLWLVGSY